MVAAAMESKRLGMCSKSMFVVPNHLTEQWASEFLRLYPSAKILVTTKKDFETKNRKKFCARIATGDYDAVIMGFSQFEKIPDRLKSAEIHLEEIKNQQKTAEAEVGKPFPYEAELAEKTARLIELDNQLNLDGSKEQPTQSVQNGVAAKEKPSILTRLKQTPAVSEKAEGKVKKKSLEER